MTTESIPSAMEEMGEWLDPTAIKTRLQLYRSNLTPKTAAALIFTRIVLLLSHLRSLPLALLPRFVRKDGLQPSKAVHVTSYLDALRGVAAVIVVNHHYLPYEPTWIMQLPFVRILAAGRGMVDVFFVISGYVLSYRMLKLMRTRRATPLLDSFASSVFRRYLRLYASAAVAAFISMVLVWLDWGAPNTRVGTFYGQLRHWMDDMGTFCNPFVHIDGYWHADVFKSGYLLVLWTIPIEFRGSLVVFLFCIAACKLSTKSRMALCWLIILTCYYWTVTYVALFLGGMFLADLSFTRHPERLGTPASLPQITSEKTPSPQPQPLRQRVLYATLFLIAIFLLCQPPDDLSAASWPWPQLETLIPSSFRNSPNKEHWWLSIGSLLLVFALDSSPSLQTPLKWNFSQYLGELSFGIYVMHLLVLWCLWRPHLNIWRVSLLGEEMWTYAPFLVLFWAAILWAADLFCRIDGRIVALGRWLQDQLFEW